MNILPIDPFSQELCRFDRRLSRIVHSRVYTIPDSLAERLARILQGTISESTSRPIDLSDYTTEQLIAADVIINERLFEKNLGSSFREYCVTFGDAQMKVLPKQFHGHPGNFLLSHVVGESVKSYSYREINDFVNEICCNDPQKEKGLALFMIAYLKQGPRLAKEMWQNPPQPLSRVLGLYSGPVEDRSEEIYAFRVCIAPHPANFVLTNKQMETLWVICYLVCVKEASRRIASISYYEENGYHYGKGLPFNVALFRSLLCVVDGRIRLNEVLDEDARYGVATGRGVTIIDKNGLLATKKKINEIQALYFSHKEVITKHTIIQTAKMTYEHLSYGDDDVTTYAIPAFVAGESDQDCWSDDDSEGRPPYTVHDEY